MKIKTLKNGFSLPVIGIGTWPMGGYRKHDKNNDDERDIKALRFAIDNGVTHIDTAELYARGYSEIILGKAIEGYDRKNLIIASKASLDSLLTKEGIKNACRESLKRVNTNYFDLYYLHWRNKEVPLKIQMEALEELYEEGLIKNIGVSNFKTETLREAQSYCKYPIVANQVHYNLIFRGPERDGLLKYCQDNDIMLVAYRAVELGKLANTGNSVMLDFADKYVGYTHAELAISWLISQKNVVALFGGSKLDFITENIKAAELVMDNEDIEHGRNDYDGQIEVSDSIPLA
ncbi:MAG TPA: aldo/keto reductase [Candidatus Paceibacterota bacterium]|nr:aldo/keto reductase [Candidatus Paceibacterota bacterium]